MPKIWIVEAKNNSHNKDDQHFVMTTGHRCLHEDGSVVETYHPKYYKTYREAVGVLKKYYKVKKITKEIAQDLFGYKLIWTTPTSIYLVK